MRAWLPMLALMTLAGTARAQDSVPPIEGVRVGIEYTPGVRPRLVVFPAAGFDSVRTILQRDLDYSDRFELIYVENHAGSSSTTGRANYDLYRTLGAQYGVEFAPTGTATVVRLHDLDAGEIRSSRTVIFPPLADRGFRMAVHQLADEIVRWITGTPGFAASRVAYVGQKRLQLIDSDGAGRESVSPQGEAVLSPAWAPDGRSLVYTHFDEGLGTLQLLFLANRSKVTVPTTREGLNYAASFSPDGRTLTFTRSGEGGTDIFSVNIGEMCCSRRLTASRFADNLSSSYSPDGRRIAFVSTRAGPPQIYVMSADGTDQELLANFDFGATGSSFAPEWSPDGAQVVFHRQVNGRFQVFVLDLVSRRVRQLTSVGRNEDPTWAPDGRHVAFVSTRGGPRQLWVIDVETGRVRQLRTPDSVRLPSWSRRLGGSNGINH